MSDFSEVEERGSEQFDALRIVRNLRDRAFDSSNEKLALALGRPLEEIETITDGNAIIDDDVIMKARGIAQERGVEVDA
ncbi:MAG TPA: hypothetical protein VN643_15855 [Pyrinomonadaceae bacterium]|nr:hypothetical protein [Pyrinomonadaceae bacterium]